MWVSFSKDFRWKPKATVTIAYKPGMRLSVTRGCGMAAIRAGAAQRVPTPSREARDGYMRGIGGK